MDETKTETSEVTEGTESETRHIEVRNLGPVSYLDIPVPPDGGLVLLRGPNGSGKTTAVRGVGCLLGDDTDYTRKRLKPKDGVVSGSVSGLGVQLHIGGRVNRTGKLTVESVAGRVGLGELVKPAGKNPATCDKARIKALAQLRGVKPDLAHFHHLAGGQQEFEALFADVQFTAPDVAELAEQVRKAFHAKKREQHSLRDRSQGQVVAKLGAMDEVDLTAECDEKLLQKLLEDSITARAEAHAQVTQSRQQAQQVAEASIALGKAKHDYSGPSVAEAREAVHKFNLELVAAADFFGQATEQLAAAQRNLEKTTAVADAATKRVTGAEVAARAAVAHQKALDGWQQTIEQVTPGMSTERLLEAFDIAETQVTRSHRAVEQGTAVRRAKALRKEADLAEAVALLHDATAKSLEEAARASDEVLSKLVSSAEVPVRDGRLVMKNTPRGETLLDELSDGELVCWAGEEYIDNVGPGGVTHLPQEAYQALDADGRRAMVRWARAHRVVIIAALVDEVFEEGQPPELRAEVVGGHTPD